MDYIANVIGVLTCKIIDLLYIRGLWQNIGCYDYKFTIVGWRVVFFIGVIGLIWTIFGWFSSHRTAT
jgi:hypothetical protein